MEYGYTVYTLYSTFDRNIQKGKDKELMKRDKELKKRDGELKKRDRELKEVDRVEEKRWRVEEKRRRNEEKRQRVEDKRQKVEDKRQKVEEKRRRIEDTRRTRVYKNRLSNKISQHNFVQHIILGSRAIFLFLFFSVNLLWPTLWSSDM